MIRATAAALLVLASLASAGCADNLLKERPVNRAARTTGVKPTFSATRIDGRFYLVLLAALLFAALTTGTSTRNLDPDIFRPELASNLTTLIQGLVVLFIGADVLILYIWSLRRKVRGKGGGPEPDSRQVAA